MELHAVDGQRLVAQAHDDVAGLGRDFEVLRKAGAVDDQRMIARCLEGRGHVLEHALALVLDAGKLAVHGGGRAHHLAAEHLADRLMAEADAEQRHLRLGRGPDEIHADAGFVGRARTRRQHDAGGPERHRLVDRDLVVAMHDTSRTQVAQEVDEVVGEAVVIIDQEQHLTFVLLIAWQRRRISTFCAGLFKADSALVEIALHGIGRARFVGKGDISIRPQQIERVSGEACLAMLRSPFENMQRHIVFPAPRRQLRRRGAIDMELPGHRHQRMVIIHSLDGDPRQAVAAMDIARFAFAQGTMTIVQHDLRYRPEHPLAPGIEFRQDRDYRWYDAHANDVSEPSLGSRQREYPIRRLDQAAREGNALGLVAVEQLVWRTVGKDGLQLPGEIDRVADAGVHALAAGRAMDMRRVAQQEGASVAEMLRYAVMDTVGREPVYLFDLDLEVVDYPAADILEFERIGVIGAFVSHRPDQARAPLAGKGKHGEEVGLVEIGVQFAVYRRSGRLDIRDIEKLAIGGARKARAHRLSHDGMRAVAAGDVGGFAMLVLAIACTQVCRDAPAVIAITKEL